MCRTLADFRAGALKVKGLKEIGSGSPVPRHRTKETAKLSVATGGE